jgi:hypothetical protein
VVGVGFIETVDHELIFGRSLGLGMGTVGLRSLCFEAGRSSGIVQPVSTAESGFFR